jgi:NADH-quinone oxidoreductase subunit N
LISTALIFPAMLLSIISAIGAPFIPGWEQLRPFTCEFWLVATMIGVLLTPFFTTRHANLFCPAVALMGLLAAFVSTILVHADADMTGEYLRGLLLYDGVAFCWKILLLVFTAATVLMWYATSADQGREGDAAEYLLLLLGAALGMSLMVSTRNLLMMFMAVELASLPSYVLAGFRKTSKLGAEASLKYVLFGAACSSVMAYGLSLLYGVYGTLQLDDIATAMASSVTGPPALVAVSLLALLVGIGFKIGAVPFHFWCPDVFEGTTADVSLFLSVASKAAGILILLRVVQTFAAAYQFNPSSDVLNAIAIVVGGIGILTATAGNTAAFVQTNVRRLLAYSSIAHAGYLMCVVALVTKTRLAGADFDPQAVSIQAVLVYLLVYTFMNLGAFTVAGAVARQMGSDDLAGYANLRRRSPILAVCMAVALISLIGIPPLAGFWAKANIFLALIANRGWYWVPAIAIGINTIASLYYYLRVIKVMYLDESSSPRLRFAPLGTTIALVSAGVLIVLFVAWEPLLWTAARYGKLLAL